MAFEFKRIAARKIRTNNKIIGMLVLLCDFLSTLCLSLGLGVFRIGLGISATQSVHVFNL